MKNKRIIILVYLVAFISALPLSLLGIVVCIWATVDILRQSAPIRIEQFGNVALMGFATLFFIDLLINGWLWLKGNRKKKRGGESHDESGTGAG